MSEPIQASVPAWAAFLILSEEERGAFLAAAGAYSAAAAALKPAAAPVPCSRVAMELSRSPDHASSLAEPAAEPRKRFAARATHSVPPLRALQQRPNPASLEAPSPIATTALPSQPVIDLAPLPVIGGAALDLAPRAIFTETGFRDRWRPGNTIGVYCAGNRRLAAFIRPLKTQAYAVGSDGGVGKVGTARDIARRIAELGTSAHAGVSKADPTRVDPGFRCWAVEPLPIATLEPSPGSPVRVVGDGLELTLPATLTPNAFDKSLAKALSGASLAGWAMSAAGQAACVTHGVDPLSLVRGTSGPGGTVAWATELVLIRPRHDGLRLLRVCEQIVIDHVMVEPAIAAAANARTTDVPSPRRRVNTTAKQVAVKAGRVRR